MNADINPPKQIDHIHYGMLPEGVRNWFSGHVLEIALACSAVFAFVIIWLLLGAFNSKVIIGTQSINARSSDSVLSSAITTQTNNYQLKLQYPDKTTKQFTLAQIGLSPNSSQSIDYIRSQQKSLEQRLLWWKPINAKVSYNVNKTQYNNFLAKETSVILEPPKDASISLSSGQVAVADGVNGKQYMIENPANTVKQHLASLSSAPLSLKLRPLEPTVPASSFLKYKDTLKAALDQPITIIFENTKITPGPTDIANWLEITANHQTKQADVTVNSGKVQQYIENATSGQVRAPKNQVVIRNSDGSQSVVRAGQNGVSITNKAEVSKAIADKLLEAKGIQQTLNASYTAFKTVTSFDYSKWIEVNISTKRMYAYENTNVVNSFLISAGAPATPTVTGQYKIYAKYAIQDMRGANVDGSSYFQPNVRWVNYFYGGYAIHGNYWRPSSWFGNINSSHGCVGLPDDEAEWVYNWAPIGTPVVIHT